MSFHHTYNLTYSEPGDPTVLTTAVTVVGDAQVNISLSIPPLTTDAEIDIGFRIGELSALFLHTSQPIHVKTNDAEEPDNQFDLLPGAATVFIPGQQYANVNPFAQTPGDDEEDGGVQTLYVSNASSTKAATFNLRALLDATPTL